MAERLFVRLDGDPLYAPETSVPTGTLREFQVPTQLRPWVAHVIAYEEDFRAGEEVHERVLPDGSMHLIFELGGGRARSRVTGARLAPAHLVMRGEVRGLSIKLRPGASQALFGASAHELAHGAVAWDDLVGARERSLPERLQDAGSDTGRLSAVTRSLHRMLRRVDEGGWTTARRARDLLAAPHRPPVQVTAQALGLTERRLQQLFQTHLGISPREWRRLSRLHDCLRMLRRGEPVCWVSLAADCGYSDQSHLIRDFRDLCGFTPGQFLRRISGSSKTSA